LSGPTAGIAEPARGRTVRKSRRSATAEGGDCRDQVLWRQRERDLPKGRHRRQRVADPRSGTGRDQSL